MTDLPSVPRSGPKAATPKPALRMLDRPPWAAYLWSDAHGIYVELPCPVGKAPHIARYARTEGGFAKALALVEQCANKDKSPPLPGYFRHGEAKIIPLRPKPNLKASPEVLQEAVKAVLRRRGLV